MSLTREKQVPLTQKKQVSLTVGLVSPGAMGASVGAAARSSGAEVLWAGMGRSEDSRARAERASLTDCGDLASMVEQADIILSVCPPHDAVNLAHRLAGFHFDGIYLEGNAISPDRTRNIEKIISAEGAEFVDGGIIGGPAWKQESGTRLYLSGARAQTIADLFTNSPLETSIISTSIGAASALKMVFAAYTKGSTALLTAVLAVAEAEGVRADLEKQWGDEFTRQTHFRVTNNTAKAWRFAGEMREISNTFSDAGVSGDFHYAAADVFEKLAEFKDHKQAPRIEKVIEVLLKGA